MKYSCKKCGNCCRAGLEVLIEREDIQLWKRIGKTNMKGYIQIDPKCISFTGLGGYHIEEANILMDIRDKYNDKDFNKKLDELKDFILLNHDYLGKGPPLPIYTFLPNLGRTPILIPKNFNILMKGLERGLIYILRFEIGGYCPFLKENLCSINEFKPNVCKSFPYDKLGELRMDNFFLKNCKGFTLD